MIRILLCLMASLFIVLGAEARKYPKIEFEKTTVDIGTFSEDDPVQKATFKFKNTGEKKLVINYVHTSCGCTAADFPKDFIAPGDSGQITVTYDGSGKLPGPMKKYVQIFTNCKDELTRIFIQGYMTAVPQESLKRAQEQ